VTTEPVRIGIIGCGNVLSAYRLIIDKLRAAGLAEPVMLCGRTSQRESACNQVRVEHFVTEPEKLIASPNVDLVVVLTPPDQHAHLAAAALKGGKHVLVEKPMAITLEEGQRLLDLANRSPGYLVCAPFTALSPTFGAVARRMQRGDIGKPCSARARYGWSGPWWSDWFYKPGGGCLFDLGVYGVTTLTGLLGSVHRVMAMTGIAIPERLVGNRPVRVEAEDNAQVLLEFESAEPGRGAFGVVTTGFTIQQYRCPAVEIYGTTGVVQMLGDDWDPDGYELWQNSVGAWQLFKETEPDWPWTDGLRHLVECVRTGKKPIVTPEHAYHVLEIMVKAQQSSAEGRAVEIVSGFVPPAFAKDEESKDAHLVHDRSRPHEGGY
jgi:predicted dehydrogenase